MDIQFKASDEFVCLVAMSGLSCIGMDIQFRASDEFVCLTAMSGLSCIGMEMKFTAALDGRKNVLSGATVPLGILSAA